ncbi:MAG TPA: DUF983 domain-containing protein [Patescibacteria group bacterium]|nr:DUF983 domain-containing protein [Patescibacteria group bacterium]
MTQTEPDTPAAPLSLTGVLCRGLRGKCPACGEGDIFRAHLKVADRCSRCSEDFHHHRADDFPAYIVILIIGHILVPLVMFAEKHFEPPYIFHVIAWPIVAVGLSWLLLQPVKGAVVALQWHIGLHGFHEARKNRVK